MHLRKLQMLDFKNYEEQNLHFNSKINVLVGPNGSGKTNLLDAIYYLSFTKSAFQSSDPVNIRTGAPAFLIKGEFANETRSITVDCAVQLGAKKLLREDGREYHKFSEHIGKYPVVLVAPDDTEIIKGSSDIRRKFFDGTLSQIDHTYLDNLLNYNQALKQRNGLLRLFFESGKTDHTALDSYDHMLALYGKPIFEVRKSFVQNFKSVFENYYAFLVDEKERPDLTYTSQAEESISEGLKKSRKKDLAVQRTSFGIHRDDYTFLLDELDVKKMGSQGQQKSFVIALRLAQWEMIEQTKGFKPILLLDDIFDKLDDFRISRLLELIRTKFGQLFITDARPDRSQELLRKTGVEATVFNVENGSVSEI